MLASLGPSSVHRLFGSSGSLRPSVPIPFRLIVGKFLHIRSSKRLATDFLATDLCSNACFPWTIIRSSALRFFGIFAPFCADSLSSDRRKIFAHKILKALSDGFSGNRSLLQCLLPLDHHPFIGSSVLRDLCALLCRFPFV